MNNINHITTNYTKKANIFYNAVDKLNPWLSGGGQKVLITFIFNGLRSAEMLVDRVKTSLAVHFHPTKT